MSRCVLYETLRQAFNVFDSHGIMLESWVEDVNQRAEGSDTFVTRALLAAGHCLATLFTADDMELSGKSVIMGTHARVVRQVHNDLQLVCTADSMAFT